MNPNQLMRTNRCSCPSNDRGYKYNQITSVRVNSPVAKQKAGEQVLAYHSKTCVRHMGVFSGRESAR